MLVGISEAIRLLFFKLPVDTIISQVNISYIRLSYFSHKPDRRPQDQGTSLNKPSLPPGIPSGVRVGLPKAESAFAHLFQVTPSSEKGGRELFLTNG
jgi:hypothetical protein